MKRAAVIKKLKAEAKRRGLEFAEIALTRHDAYRVGNTTRTLGRHREIDDVTAKKFFDQFAQELGKGWWR
ncbi:ribonuclease PH [Corynebacterium phoceense]|uniref:ribonuclease PH n=1 Tax=Corynebacterium phoceense TaxID=1686286 RepID=UPI00211C461E|nr:ribonuclease PH [Corynebacterium phoceense]MCQ9339978.1 ribonuclease PH [Corynebacterium phoceense]